MAKPSRYASEPEVPVERSKRQIELLLEPHGLLPAETETTTSAREGKRCRPGR